MNIRTFYNTIYTFEKKHRGDIVLTIRHERTPADMYVICYKWPTTGELSHYNSKEYEGFAFETVLSMHKAYLIMRLNTMLDYAYDWRRGRSERVFSSHTWANRVRVDPLSQEGTLSTRRAWLDAANTTNTYSNDLLTTVRTNTPYSAISGWFDHAMTAAQQAGPQELLAALDRYCDAAHRR
jgi:hypothetical protein